MTGTVVALVFFIVSVVFAIINPEIKSASLWALWAIFMAIFLGGHYALPLP
jgi:hypothetical protein